jgi:RNA polymerase sigma-70 factor (ECF subfamily)
MENMPGWQDSGDFELLKVAKEGDTGAFGELYERHSRVVFRFLYAHLSDRLDAEDLTEEVFLRAWRSLSAYNDQ